MRKLYRFVILMFLLIGVSSFCFAQLDASFPKDTVKLTRLTDGDFTTDLKISVKSLNSFLLSH